MKTGEDFRREFPAMEPQFEEAAQRALHGLQEKEEERRMKLRPLLVIAVALVLLMGVGVAATWERWSLEDFIPTSRITATDEEWQAMIAAFEPVTAECQVADVTVREALYDGYALYIVVDVDPKQDRDFFVPEMAEMDAKAERTADSLPEDMTLREYIALNGYTRTFEVRMSTGYRGLSFLPEMELNEDGTMTFYLRQRLQQTDPTAEQLDMKFHVMMDQTAGQGFYWVDIPLTLQRLPVLEEAFSAAGESSEFANSGVELSNLRLIRTPLSTYVTMDVRITDQAAYDARFGSYVVNFVGPEGAELDPGPFNLAGFMRELNGPEMEPGEPYYEATLTISALPDTITVIESPWGERDPAKATDRWVVRLEKTDR